MSASTRHNVHMTGEGRSMMFAHGFGCDQNMWRLVAPAFAESYRTILFDAVGAGGSDLAAWDARKYASLQGYVDDVIELAQELGVRDGVFVGHSVSAMIGVLASKKAPELFDALVLVGPSPRYIDDGDYVGGFSEAQVHELLDFLDSNHMGWSEAMAPVIMGNPDRPELGAELTNSFCRTDPEIAKQFARVTFLSDNRADLAEVTTPSLVLQCSDDVIAPQCVGEYVARHLPNSKLVLMKATGHCPNLSAPEETIAAMKAFLWTEPAPNASSGAVVPEREDLEDLFENAPCGYVSMGGDGRITRANRTFEAWTGWDRSDLLGKKFQDLLNIAGKIYYETHFAPLLRMQGFFNEVALEIVCQDGTALPVLVNAVERRGSSGELLFIRITIFNASDRRRYERELMEARRAAEKTSADLQHLNAHLEARVAEAIEERLKAEAALRQAQKLEAVGQLTGGIAHDFNNMMAVVLSGLTLIERRLARGDTDVASLIVAAREGADRAVALTQRLLAFSRQQALSPRPLDANTLIADMSDLLRRTLGEAVRLETRLAPDLWRIHADANQLENAIVNLAINSRDAMPNGGHLTIETANVHLDERAAAEIEATAGEHVLVAVTDTGIGMSTEVASRVFEPFFTTKGPGKGTGLGLSQVFGFVKQSGGHVAISSTPGKGTCVKVLMPRFHGALSQEDPTVAFDILPAGRSEVILLVEDDVQVRQLSEAMLRDLGYVVLSAANGVDALALLGTRSDVRLMFTDVVLPGINGWQLAEEAQRRQSNLKVIYITGYKRDAIEGEGFFDQNALLLSKPIILERLAETMRAALDR